MIDFQNGSFFKLRAVPPADLAPKVAPLLLPEETILATFKNIRDGVVFTDKRVIAVNVQGVTGKKTDFTSMPYSKIQIYSVETAGVFDLDSELDLYFSGVGKIRFEFAGSVNIAQICAVISRYVL